MRPLPPLLVGMVHLLPLPGSPRFSGDMRGVVEGAVADARTLMEAGFPALMVENFGDAPFFPGLVPSETVAGMTRALLAVREACPGLALGVNVLRNDLRSALGIAAAAGADFARVNIHVGAAVADQGILEGRAWETVRVRSWLCPQVALLADVQVKHARPLGQGSDAAEEARELLYRGLADALVVSGAATGSPVNPEVLDRVHGASPGAPVYIGSGATADSAYRYARRGLGILVGTAIKRDGDVSQPVDPSRARLFVEAVREARSSSLP